ncbi:hypothetical protein [Mitsuaria sp. GD03876]|uniref:hypothetical protein n=1 Tax=Mitsuaria sp. GD03876 TaxID=2975399 RepID=UPI002448327C|nr:hypothetical protein [Mitsuaria sp. GD03876]MDH0865396.1 hypothetical protein [Mitsuaria sp. GD03876]
MTLFNTLLLREWLQHKWAWIGIVLAPILLMLVLVPISQVEGINVPSPEPVALIAGLMTAGLVMVLALSVSGYQLLGLARRDQQDRSIEFWSSLPGSHAAALGAPILAHGVLMPIVAIVLGIAGGAVVGTAMAFKEFGVAALHQTQWSALIQAAVWLAVRTSVGVVMASLWIAPIALALMAASAWLKRWGAPLLVVLVGGFLKIYKDTPIADAIVHTLKVQMDGVASAWIQSGTRMIMTNDDGLDMQDFFNTLFAFPDYARDGLPQVFQAALEPQFFGGLVVAGLCFWLLVLQRKRSL